jgi:hypothetical protein
MNESIQELEEKVYRAWLEACLKSLAEGDACPPNPVHKYGL